MRTRITFIDMERVSKFALDAFSSVGVEREGAELTARGLVMASLQGVDSHGIRLLPQYIAEIEGGRINLRADMRFDQTTASTGRFDADHSLGPAAGIIAMDHAILLAQNAGIGLVSMFNSSHCGMLAYYALHACEKDMIGLVCTHATAKLSTPNCFQPFFGSNPICVTAPMIGEAPFCFDAATSVLTGNKIKYFHEMGLPLPEGSAVDAEGEGTIEPAKAKYLLPIGDYKGFGLAMVVDIFSGLLSGMPSGPEVSNMYGDPLSEKRRLGHIFGAIRIASFQDPVVFKTRLQKLADSIRRAKPRNNNQPVQIPGDPEKRKQVFRSEKGIPFTENELEIMNIMARKLGIASLD
jgi:LDH2 family malate/lactate/ureidoglycolate dehydrogenase